MAFARVDFLIKNNLTMHLKRTIKTLAITAFLAMTAATASAQDLLARQAPIDKKMKAVDTLALRNLINKEQHFCMPTTSKVITSNFGRRWGRMHKGIDIKVYIGDTIRSAFSGKVRIVKYEANGYGNYVVIRHYNGLETIYGHMSKHLVKENQIVKAGEPIGLGGNTGRSTGSHLHFETRLCGVALNPALMFDFRNQDVTGDTYMFHRDTYENESVLANKARGKSAGDDEAVAEETSSSKSRKQSSASSSDIRYHKVKRGETLSSIAKKRGTTIDKLCKLNHISKRMRIRPGQILRYS